MKLHKSLALTTFLIVFLLLIIKSISFNREIIIVDDNLIFEYFHINHNVQKKETVNEITKSFNQKESDSIYDKIIHDEILFQYGLNKEIYRTDPSIKSIIIDRARNSLELSLIADIKINNETLRNFYLSKPQKYRLMI